MQWNACPTCSTINVPLLTNNILSFWRCRCLNSSTTATAAAVPATVSVTDTSASVDNVQSLPLRSSLRLPLAYKQKLDIRCNSCCFCRWVKLLYYQSLFLNSIIILEKVTTQHNCTCVSSMQFTFATNRNKPTPVLLQTIACYIISSVFLYPPWAKFLYRNAIRCSLWQ